MPPKICKLDNFSPTAAPSTEFFDVACEGRKIQITNFCLDFENKEVIMLYLFELKPATNYYLRGSLKHIYFIIH